MKLGIIGAMDIEISMLKDRLENMVVEEISSMQYYIGKISNTDVVISKCGAGKVNAAACTQAMVMKYSPDSIINIGVAGSLSSKLKIGDLVISDAVVQHDMDTTKAGDPIGFISGINKIKLESSKKLTQDIFSMEKKINDCDIYIGTIATGDQFVGSDERKDFIVKNFDAICVEMEGASIGYICYINNVDFTIIRSISDNADGTSDIDFRTFAEVAAQNSINLIYNYILSCQNN